MIVQVTLLCLVSVAVAQPVYGPPAYPKAYEPAYPKAYEPAYPKAYEQAYEKPQPYSFGYDVKDEYGATQSRKEEGDDYGNKRGSYGYTDGYGIYRHVDYVADAHGFRASIKTNEPGTENQNPADVEIHSEAQPAKYEAPLYKPAPAYKVVPEYSKPAPSYKPAPAYPEPAYNSYPAPAPVYAAPVYSAPLYDAPAYKPAEPEYKAAPVYETPGEDNYAPY